GGPVPAPPFVTLEIVSPAERPFKTSPEITPYASPPRPPFVPTTESPPRPPCIVVPQFDEKSGDVYTAAIPAAVPPLPPNPVAMPPRMFWRELPLVSTFLALIRNTASASPPVPPFPFVVPPFPPSPPPPPVTPPAVFVNNWLIPTEFATSMATAVPASPPRPPAV